VSDAVWRDVHRGRVWRAQACRVVEDSPETIVLWMPGGAPAMLPVGADGGRVRIPGDEWELEEIATSEDILCVARPGRAHSIYLYPSRDEADRHWYVNFEEPLRRTPLGLDTFDWKLDLIVQPDRSYRWKDEDELEQAGAAGLVDPDEVRAEAARVLAEWPFPTGWEGWRPDPGWRVPRLPHGWDRV
jgi:hypothetical protein